MSLTTLIKDIQALAKDSYNSELQEKLINLRESVLEMQEENFSLREEIFNLKTKIQAIESELSTVIDKTYRYESPFYWKVDGITKEGPFCQHCLDVKKRAIRLQERIKGAWFCTNCDIIYKTSTFQDPRKR